MIRSYKLHFVHRRVRIAMDDTTAGVDIVGEAAAPIFAASEPLVSWLRERDADASLRALYIHPRTPRALVSMDPPRGSDTRPWVLKLEGSDAAAFLEAAPDLERVVRELAELSLFRRV